MPKAKKTSSHGSKPKLYATPTAQKKRDFGVPKFARQAMPAGAGSGSSRPSTAAALSALAAQSASLEAGPSTSAPVHLDASLSIRDSSTKAFMRELRKVIEKSDVIIQVLDARDPEGTRSRWVEDEVRKREADGKKLLGVINKIDLVPRATLEGWLRHLRHSFPCMPFKSSTQAQRNNLSQNAVPISHKTGETIGELPITSSSLGAPALLNLLKQYALSTHSTLTVGVVGYPNVGKSSLINSLKRSRACAVAAMPGKTRVVQEVVLDKGVKIIDCPGVVLADMAGADQQKQAELMLRNCIKAELVEDPVAPVEAILRKTDPELLQKMYSIPPFADVREFLIRIALVRGRLGKGGIPDLEASAVSVLRDWNSGKIPYHTPAPVNLPATDVEMGERGDKVLNQLSAAFSLDGLLDFGAGGAGGFAESADPGGEEWDGGMDQQEEVDRSTSNVPKQSSAPASSFPNSDSEDDSDHDDDADSLGAFSDDDISHPSIPSHLFRPTGPSKLFTPEELAALPPSIAQQRTKAAIKKAKKRRADAERTGGELALDMLGMDVDEAAANKPDSFVPEEWDGRRLSKKERKVKAKERAKARAQREANAASGMGAGRGADGGDVGMEAANGGDADVAGFERFLAGVADMSDDEL